MLTSFSFRFPQVLVTALCSILAMGASLPTAPSPSLSSSQVSVNFPAANSDRGAPSRSQGAGSRGACEMASSEDGAMAALTPQENILKTAASNPDIYIFVPELANKQAEFIVVNRQTETIAYETVFPVNRTAGILKLSLPETVALEADATYEWSFSIVCDRSDRGADMTIAGWIERSPLTQAQKAEIERVRSRQQPLEVAEFYAQSGFWAETLDLLLSVRESNPTAWQELLRSVELEQLTQVPLSQPLPHAPGVLRGARVTTGL